MVKDTILYFLSKFLPSIISFLILALYLTKMDPKEYGKLSIFILTIGLVGILSSQWIRSSMIRYYYEYKNTVVHAMFLQIIIILIVSGITFSIGIVMKVSVFLMLLCIISLVSLLINELYNNYFRIVIQPEKVLIGNVIKNLFYIFFLFIVILEKDDISFSQALTAYLIGLLVSNLYYVISSNKRYQWSPININILKRFAIYGVPLTISFALGVLLQNIDKYMITYKLGTQSNGNYSLVFDFVHNYLYMIMGALGLASLPRMLKNSNFQKRTEDFQNYINIFHLMCLPILFIFIIFTPELSALINYYNYETNIYILTLIGIATYVHGINSYIYGQGYQLMENTKYILFPSLVAVLVNTIINWLFLQKYGVIISAVSTLIAFSVSNLLLYRTLNKIMTVKIFNNRTIKLILYCSVIVMLILFIQSESVFINIGIKIFVMFCCFYYLFKKKGFLIRR